MRDYVGAMGTFEPGDHLAEAVTHAALVAPTALRPRVAGLAAAIHATGPRSMIAMAMADLAPGDSLADLVRHSVGCGVPPDAITAVLREALPAVVDRLLDRSTPSSGHNTPNQGTPNQDTPDQDGPGEDGSREDGSSPAAPEVPDPIKGRATPAVAR